MKVLLMGSSGVGKSTTAELLAKELHLPVLHMDSISHDQYWNHLPAPLVEQRLLDFLNDHDQWIIDGHYPKYLYQQRVEAADTIIFFHFPAWRSFYNCLRRVWRNKQGSEQRIGTPHHQDTTLRWRFVYYLLWKYPIHIRPKTLHYLRKHFRGELHMVHSFSQLSTVLARLLPPCA